MSHLRRALAASVAGVAFVLAVVMASNAHAADDEGLRRRGGYVQLSPGVLGVNLGHKSYHQPYYIWGASAGYHLPVGRVFALQVGAYFEHGAWAWDSLPYYLKRHLLRLGPELRLGGGSPRVFGYGLLRVGVDVVYKEMRHACRDCSPPTQALPLLAAGGGVQGLLGRRFLAGGEASAQFNFASVLIHVRVFVGWKF